MSSVLFVLWLFLVSSDGADIPGGDGLTVNIFEESRGFTFEIKIDLTRANGWAAIAVPGYFPANFVPTAPPSAIPTGAPTMEAPTAVPTTGLPSREPSVHPSHVPTVQPSKMPTVEPSTLPGSLAFTCTADELIAYRLETRSAPQVSWREDDLISSATLTIEEFESAPHRVCRFSVPSLTQDQLQVLLYSFNSNPDCPAPTASCPHFGPNTGYGAFSGQHIERLDVRADIARLDGEIVNLRDAVEAMPIRPVGTENVASKATNVVPSSSCYEEDDNGVHYLYDGNQNYPTGEGLPDPTKGWRACQTDNNPRIDFRYNSPITVGQVIIYNRNDQVNQFRKTEAWVSFPGMEPYLCGKVPNNYGASSFGAFIFECGNRVGTTVTIRKPTRNFALAEIEIWTGIPVAELTENSIPVVPSYSPKEIHIESMSAMSSISAYVNDVLVFPEGVHEIQSLAECSDVEFGRRFKVTEPKTYRFQRGDAINCNDASSILEVAVSVAPDDLTTNAFATGTTSMVSAPTAAGLTEEDRNTLNAAAVMASSTAADVGYMKSTMQINTHQMVLMQLRFEHENRVTGDSGIRSIRGTWDGTDPYFRAGTAYEGNRVLAIHNHANFHNTLGMGELFATLNGVTFSTRHNDYKLKQVSADAAHNYGATEDIPHPPVPESVLNMPTPEEQVAEMKEYFKAWQLQDETHRAYKDYFKPVLCYLEGHWYLDDDTRIEDPFDSDRHRIDAEDWNEQHQQELFFAASGKKDPLENIPWLPTKIVNVEVNSDGIPVPKMAHWTYRILCNPISQDVPLDRFVLDLPEAVRAKKFAFAPNQSNEEREEWLQNSRLAHFRLKQVESGSWKSGKTNPDRRMGHRYSFLDELMEGVSGRDGPAAELVDDSLGSTARHFLDSDQILNTAKYSRRYSFGGKDANGRSTQTRGFTDNNLFAAMTSHPEVPADTVCAKKQDGGDCWEQRWTYAIPLEIVYLTPLYNWNPFEIPEFQTVSDWSDAQQAHAGGDGKTAESAVYGYTMRDFLKTPAKLFEDEVSGSTADTGAVRFAKGSDGVGHRVIASGTRHILPSMFVDDEEFQIRLRYPIAPMYTDSQPGVREARALRDLKIREQRKKIDDLESTVSQLTNVLGSVLSSLQMDTSVLNNLGVEVDSDSEARVGVFFESTFPQYLNLKSGPGNPSAHRHDIFLDWDAYVDIMEGKTVAVQSELWDEDHLHKFTFRLGANGVLEFMGCDSCDDDPHATIHSDPQFEHAFTHSRRT